MLSLSSRQNHSPIKVTQAVPLAIAAVKGYKQIVERLLKAGANQNYHTKVIEYMYFPSISWICTLLYIVDLVYIYVMCALYTLMMFIIFTGWSQPTVCGQ